MTLRFASWPTFNGKKVVLEDDARLVPASTPTVVNGDTTITLPADNQNLAFVAIRVDGTLRIDGTLVML